MAMDAEVAKDGSQGSREEKEAERKEAVRKEDCEGEGALWRLLMARAKRLLFPSALAFYAKGCCPLALCGDRGEVERLPAPGPLLSHPMTGGPEPAGQRRDHGMEGGKAESEPPEPRDGLE
jgi:hypothetical protein